MNADYINLIPDIESRSYLELGIGNGASFAAVKAQTKKAVDPNGRADFTMGTDEYFRTHRKKYDVIFIDANHDFDNVLRDFNSAVKACKEWVVIHDLIPPAEKYTAPRFCSDGYKLLAYLIRESGLSVYPMSENMGLTFIRMPAAPVFPPDGYRALTYAEFMKGLVGAKLYSKAEIESALK